MKSINSRNFKAFSFTEAPFPTTTGQNCFDGPAPCDESICDERCDCDCDCDCDKCDCDYTPNSWEEDL